MKILVTGATGFIGGHLARRLASKGNDVVCLVRKTGNISSLKDIDGITLVTCDILDYAGLLEIFDRVSPEAVVHSAALVMSRDRQKLYEANGEGTANICKACWFSGVDRLVYVSSVAVVSGNDVSPVTDELPYKATNEYGDSKIEAERVVLSFRKEGLKSVIIRPCVVVGEGETHALGKILAHVAKRHIPLPDMPEAEAKLQLVYVGNVAQIIELALEKEEATEGTFTVADKEIITMKKFLEILYEEVGGGEPPVVPKWIVKLLMVIPYFDKKMEHLFKDRTYDISRAENLLGYSPEVSTEEGLRRAAREWLCRKLK